MRQEDTSVFIVDDHLVVRQGLRSLLAQYPGIRVVGEADGGPDTIELITSLQPDVVLLDIRLAGPSGLDLARQLQRAESQSRIIILTSYDDESYLLEAAQAGVYGYVLKSTSAEILADAIQAVHRGERRLSRAVAGKALEQLETLVQARVQAEIGLSDQELQLLHLIADGATTQDMAGALYISERTVKRKVQDVLDKLEAANRAQAVSKAYKRGLL
jgi:DNA-binding NarL/FixJ family response regulator